MPTRAARPLKRPLKRPSQERSRLTVEAILDAAIQVFEQHGHAAGTTTRIAERAGVSIGSLYQYFPSKDAVLQALAERHLAEGSAVLAGLLGSLTGPPRPLQPLLTEVVEAMVALHRQNPRLHRLLYRDGLLPAALHARLEQARQVFIAQVAALLARHPEVPPGDDALRAYFLVHTVEHFTHLLVIEPPERRLRERVATELVQLLERYLRGGSGLEEKYDSKMTVQSRPR